jgi:hypothetical protein
MRVHTVTSAVMILGKPVLIVMQLLPRRRFWRRHATCDHSRQVLLRKPKLSQLRLLLLAK